MSKMSLMLQIQALRQQKGKEDRKFLTVYEVVLAMRKYRDPYLWEALKACYTSKFDQVRAVAALTGIEKKVTMDNYVEIVKLCEDIRVNPISPLICFADGRRLDNLKTEARRAGFKPSLVDDIKSGWYISVDDRKILALPVVSVGKMALVTNKERLSEIGHMGKELEITTREARFIIDQPIEIQKLVANTIEYMSLEIFKASIGLVVAPLVGGNLSLQPHVHLWAYQVGKRIIHVRHNEIKEYERLLELSQPESKCNETLRKFFNSFHFEIDE